MSTRTLTAELAREELHGAHVEGDTLSTAPLMRETSTSTYPFNSDPEDPNVLYSILEEAIPKQQHTQQNAQRSFGHDSSSNGAGLDKQQQRDLLDLSYERIRRWMWSHNTLESRQAAVYVRGQNDSTPLHLVCKLHNPPADIVQAIVEAAPEVCGWTDAQGWLPIHHACAHGVSPDVLTLLILAFPDGKLQPDHQGRTPLHFYATRNSDNVVTMALNAEMLSNTGAAALRDAGGMLPVHYASAYGTHSAVLEVLVKAYPESVTAVENHGRTPMHLAMVNAHRDASPGVIRFLLDHPTAKQTINARDKDGHLPLHLMALGLKGYKPDDRDKKSHVCNCLEMYLAAEPVAAADFLTAIQDLPDWLQDTAVVSKHVRNILNDKIVQRFPTSILMLDGMFLFSLIICFAITTNKHIDLRLGTNEYIAEQGISKDDTSGALIFLYVGAGYFVMRELMQMGSIMGLNSFAKYFGDPSTWLDMTVIVLVLYYAVAMTVNDYNTIAPDNQDYLNEFRTGVAVTQGILWAATIVFLKSTLVDFAVFVGGLFHVAQRLVAFLIAVSTILLAFAQMFYFAYLDTDICEVPTISLAFAPEDGYFDPDLVDCNFPHCEFGNSLLKVYTMMMGEIGDVTRYSSSLTAQILFVGFAFLVVILLSNVLIAIVTDSYEIIQNDRAAIVFWSNRLDFVAETDAIAYAVQRRLKRVDLKDMANAGHSNRAAEEPREQQGGDDGDSFACNGEPGMAVKREISYFQEGWHQIMLLFDENMFDDVDWVETWVYNVFRVFCIFVIIPLWLTAGLVTAGWLWPPQVREYLFAQREAVISRSEMERKKLEKLKNIQTDLKSMKQEITKEMANDRIDMARMKAEVETIQNEVLVELMQLRELMGSLIM